MQTLNTARMILVACAILAAIVAAVHGLWSVVAILGVAIVLHAVMWAFLPRLYPDREQARRP